jgi:hypothetical protein
MQLMPVGAGVRNVAGVAASINKKYIACVEEVEGTGAQQVSMHGWRWRAREEVEVAEVSEGMGAKEVDKGVGAKEVWCTAQQVSTHGCRDRQALGISICKSRAWRRRARTRSWCAQQLHATV